MIVRAWQPVRRWRVAAIAGALVALQVVVALSIRPVPDAVVSLLGGPRGGVDRLGGLRVRYRPPAGLDARELEADLRELSSIRREDGALVLEFPGVPEQLAPELADILAGGGLTMRVVGEDEYARTLARYAPEGVTLETDSWRNYENDEQSGVTYHVQYLAAPTREQLERTLAQATADGWRPPAGSEIAFERIDPYRDDAVANWRSYEVSTEVAVNRTMIASAAPSTDPNTGRPIVLLEFADDGRHRFCDLTRKIVGHKLAMLLGGRVRSAPIISGPICGGLASITMGGGDVRAQEAERDMVATVLSRRAPPPGGTVESYHWYPPPDIAITEWMGRLLLGAGAGGLVALLVALALAVARPRKIVAAERVPGGFPWRRLVVTLLGLAALIVGGQLTLPGVNEVEIYHIVSHGGAPGLSIDLSIITLGVLPIVTAFGVVELVALAIPRLRWRRHDPRGRVALGQAVAVVACVASLAQGYLLASSLESLSRGGAEVVMTPGWTFRIVVMVTLSAGTLLLSVVAGMISEHGLGNGYGVLLAGPAIIKVAETVAAAPVFSDQLFDRGHALALITLVAIVLATAETLRWRIPGGEREADLRTPSSGFVPLGDPGTMTFALVALAGLGFGAATADVMGWTAALRAHAWFAVVLVAVLVPVWSWLFAAPRVTASVARQAGLDPVTRATWTRAALASAVLLVGVAAVAALATAAAGDSGPPVDLVFAMIGTAAVLDIIGDARAYRRALVPAGVLHQIQVQGVVEHVLAEAGIPCHIRASNLRTLFAFFGPWAPAIVLVPEAHAADARRRLDDLLRPSMARHVSTRDTPGTPDALAAR
jgi:hypothetical protein